MIADRSGDELTLSYPLVGFRRMFTRLLVRSRDPTLISPAPVPLANRGLSEVAKSLCSAISVVLYYRSRVVSDLTNLDKRKFERLLEMGGGYVLNFSNRTFDEFVTDTVSRNIYDSRYDANGSSKANRLRAFWQVEPNLVVGKLLGALIEYQKEVEVQNQASGNFYLKKKAEELQQSASLRAECQRIVTRLLSNQPVSELEALAAVSAEKDFEVVARAVRDAIEKNEPEGDLDRLHTFVIKYVRTLCTERGLLVARDKPLHSLFGEYVKSIEKRGIVESEMTRRILKSTISTLDAFNDVRNNRSLAHDNPILNYDEALLIFNHVASSVRFLSALQRKYQLHELERKKEPTSIVDNDIPF